MGAGRAASDTSGGAARLARAALESWQAGHVVLLPLLLGPAAGSPSDLVRIGLLLVALTLLGQAASILGGPARARSAGAMVEARAAGMLLAGAGYLLAGMLDPALRPVALSVLSVEVTLRLGRGRALPLVVPLAAAAAALRLEAAALLLDLRHGAGLVMLGLLLEALMALARERRERLVRLGPAVAGTDPAGGRLLDLSLGAAAAGVVGFYLAMLVGSQPVAAAAGSLVYVSVPLGLATLLRWWRLAIGTEVGRPSTMWLRDPALAILLGGWAASLALVLHLLPALLPAPGMLHLVAPIW
jgi:hypothetical protein